MAELIQRDDSLNTGREKLNEAIKASDRAEGKSEYAVQTADAAKSTADTTREEMVEIIREQTNGGDIVPEVVQARGGQPVLADRLNSVDSQLAQTEAEINDLMSEKADKADLEITMRRVFNAYSDVPINDAKSAFIQKMNEKSLKIGMINTNFVNPNGLNNENQVTTAKDMLLMALNALSYKDIVNVWSRREYLIEVGGDNARSINLETTIQQSSMNDNYNVSGGKTGTLPGITQNLISVVNAKHSPHWLIGCVIGADPSRFTASRQLYDIAMTSLKNQVPIKQHVSNLSNGNFDEGLNRWSVFSGNPSITKEDYFYFPQSLKANSDGTSSQLRRTLNFIPGNKYYVSAMVKCTRHSAGSLGVQVTTTNPSTTIGVSRTTNGWERVSAVIEAENSTAYLYAGGISSANLDGYVDMINVINLTSDYGAGNEPSKAQMDREYWQDVNTASAIVCQVPNAFTSFNKDNLPALFEKNADTQGYPASLTKVMTAMIMLDYVHELDDEFEIISSDVKAGSGAGLSAGDIITFNDALYLLMLPSDNTVAEAISRVVGQRIVGRG